MGPGPSSPYLLRLTFILCCWHESGSDTQNRMTVRWNPCTVSLILCFFRRYDIYYPDD